MPNPASLLRAVALTAFAAGCLESTPVPTSNPPPPLAAPPDPGLVLSPPGPRPPDPGQAEAGAGDELAEPQAGPTDPASEADAPADPTEPGSGGGAALVACEQPGEEGVCPDGLVCDLHPDHGEPRVYCQLPCERRAAPQCALGGSCRVECGQGLCEYRVFELGCATSEDCSEWPECCDRDGAIPVCGEGACPDRPCRDHAGCDEGELCVDDGCVLAADRPAPCEDGECEPPPPGQCDGDWIDRTLANPGACPGAQPILGNHAVEHAARLSAQTYTGLVLCGGTEDWFQVDLEQGQDVEITLTFDVNAGDGADLALELREGATVFDRSDEAGGVERVGINGAPFDGTYFVRVSGIEGVTSTPYVLNVRVGAICIDDALEGPRDNDTIEAASQVAPGRLPDLILCQRDGDDSSVDVYRIDLDAGAGIRVHVQWDEADGRLLGGLFDLDGPTDVAAGVARLDLAGAIVWQVPDWPGGALFLRLTADRSNDAEIGYEVRFQLACTPEERAAVCADAPAVPLRAGPDDARGRPDFFEASLSGNTCIDEAATRCFEPSCDPSEEPHHAPERVWRLDTTAAPFDGQSAVELNIRHQPAEDWLSMVGIRTGCEDDAGEGSCRLDPRRPYRETVLPGVHNIVIEGSGEDCGPFNLDLTVRPMDDGGTSRCDTCVSVAGRACELGDPEDPGLAQARWDNVGGDAGDDYEFVLQLQDTTHNSSANQFEGGVASCIGAANARFSPDTVYQFSTPEGAPEGCRLRARLTSDDFFGGLALRDACPARQEIACAFDAQLGPSELVVDELAPGDYTLWVKGTGALQSGPFTLDLGCVHPDSEDVGWRRHEPVQFTVGPLRDRAGRRIGSQLQALRGSNAGAPDTGGWGAQCRPDPHCDEAMDDDCGGETWYRFSQDNPADVWFAELEAQHPAVFSLLRGDCDDLVEVACGSTEEPIELYGLARGEYRLVVDGLRQDDRGDHRIDITSMEDGVPRPRNDGCAGEHPNPTIQPDEIGFALNHRVQLDGSTLSADHDRNPLTCSDLGADAPDVVYVYTADRAHHLDVRLFAAFRHNLYVRAEDCIEGLEVACAEGDLEDVRLGPGTYYLYVDGIGSEDTGGFSLQISFSRPD